MARVVLCGCRCQHGECDEMLASSGLPFAIIQPQILFDNLLKFQGDIIKHDRSWYGLGGRNSNNSNVTHRD
jgi:hypothetical protein